VPHKTNNNLQVGCTVEAYSRLHFGLLEIHPGAPNCFGGIGLMVDKPSVCLTVRTDREMLDSAESIDPCATWEDPYWKERFHKVYANFQSRNNGFAINPVELKLRPTAHIGLGSGTQFACAASALLNSLHDRTQACETLEPQRWTIDSGRGLRSHIGLHGFLHGQLVVDLGFSSELSQNLPERTRSQHFPEDWRVLLLHEAIYQGDSGANEQAIFDHCSKRENPNRKQMLELIQEQILPAVSSQNFQEATRGIGLYGELAGSVFSPALGDAYRTPRIRFWIDRFRSMGLTGVGQSSWGPVVFVMVQDSNEASWLLEKIRPELHQGGWICASSAAGPARVEANL
jgi:beta-RFAP synthase